MNKDFVQNIFARRSIRKYTAEPVAEKDVKTLLEVAMAAPSAANRKPWHFIVTTDRKIMDLLADEHPYGKMLFKAPMCIAVCGDPAISGAWVQDCSAATENLLLAATALDLGAVWLGVYPMKNALPSYAGYWLCRRTSSRSIWSPSAIRPWKRNRARNTTRPACIGESGENGRKGDQV